MIAPSHEDVDTRIVLQTKDAVMKGFPKLVLKTTDTDVIVICLASFSEIGAEEIWIEFGTAEKLKFYPIHEIYSLSPM